ncbi:hypothetical protein NPIL_218241 [Nephila pilipes]|uniref:Uncharacterized protein n=1 Tax=Nephila pilipes TaxID=299642 RepID=A0A8X6P4S1_NEPPI|nr:hypothetical protein NPIL_218241 [Nephila pilipes]
MSVPCKITVQDDWMDSRIALENFLKHRGTFNFLSLGEEGKALPPSLKSWELSSINIDFSFRHHRNRIMELLSKWLSVPPKKRSWETKCQSTCFSLEMLKYRTPLLDLEGTKSNILPQSWQISFGLFQIVASLSGAELLNMKRRIISSRS